MIVPCSTNVTVSINFADTTFNISPETYNVGAISELDATCVGGFAAPPDYPGEQPFLSAPTASLMSTRILGNW